MKKYILVDNNDYFRSPGKGPDMDIYDDITDLYRSHFHEEDFDNLKCCANPGVFSSRNSNKNLEEVISSVKRF